MMRGRNGIACSSTIRMRWFAGSAPEGWWGLNRLLAEGRRASLLFPFEGGAHGPKFPADSPYVHTPNRAHAMLGSVYTAPCAATVRPFICIMYTCPVDALRQTRSALP